MRRARTGGTFSTSYPDLSMDPVESSVRISQSTSSNVPSMSLVFGRDNVTKLTFVTWITPCAEHGTSKAYLRDIQDCMLLLTQQRMSSMSDPQTTIPSAPPGRIKLLSLHFPKREESEETAAGAAASSGAGRTRFASATIALSDHSETPHLQCCQHRERDQPPSHRGQ